RGEQMTGGECPAGRREVVNASALVAQRGADEHEVRWPGKRCQLSGRGDADDQAGAAGMQLLGDKDSEEGADRVADDADLHRRLSHVAGRSRRYPHVGVVASPPRVTTAVAGPGEVPYDVAIGVEQAHARYGRLGQVPLAPRLPQQVLGPED